MFCRTLLLVLISACLSTSAFAGLAVEEQRSITVAYHDLDISSSDGMEALDRRLRRAAKQVCGPSDFRTVGLSAATRNKHCADKAVARAWTKVHAKPI